MTTKIMHNLILSIDTSCDDTSAAVTAGSTILSNVIASQTQLHKEYGGVFPTVAKQAHKENILPVISVALKRAKVSWDDVAAIAVTKGPGLAPALEVGINAARDLAKEHNKPLIAVNHLEGHLLSVIAKARPRKLKKTNPKSKDVMSSGVERSKTDSSTLVGMTNEIKNDFPTLGLIISGGNSLFVLVKNIGEYEVLGSTIDDAAGECLDKIGRMLGLGYPAGPAIEQFAKLGNPKAYEFPLPMTTSKDFNLSFSGLKTFARNLITKLSTDQHTTNHIQLTKEQTYDLCASVQYAVFRHIMYKMEKILQIYAIKEVWLGGGVAANMTLRSMIRTTLKKHAKHTSNVIPNLIGDPVQPVFNWIPASAGMTKKKRLCLKVPYTKKLTVDNAAMIGIAAGFKLEKQAFVEDLEGLERVPKMKLA